jgi:hypothetical protein
MRGRDELGAAPHGGVGAQVEQPGALERVAASGVGLGRQPVRAQGLQAVLAVAPLTAEVLPITWRVTAVRRVAPHLSRAIESAALPLSCANSVESFPQVRRSRENTISRAWRSRVSWIVDSGSSHRGQASVPRWGRWHTLRLAHLPLGSVRLTSTGSSSSCTTMRPVPSRYECIEGAYERPMITPSLD